METQEKPAWVVLTITAYAIVMATRLWFHTEHEPARQPSAQQPSSQGAQEPAGGLSVQELPS
jgi:hypothetical protein